MQTGCAWTGNSQAVAAKHYLQVTAAHPEQAIKCGSDKSGEYAAQQPQEPLCDDVRSPLPPNKESPVLQGYATDRNSRQC